MKPLSVNLLPWRQRLRSRRSRAWILWLLLHLACLLLVLMLVKRVMLRHKTLLQATWVAEQKMHQAHSEQLNVIQQALAQQRHAQLAHQKNDAVKASNQRYVKLLQQLAQQIPTDVWLTTLTGDHDKVSMVGISHRYDDIMLFGSRLQTQGVLGAVQIAQVRQGKALPEAVKGTPTLGFQFQAAWRGGSGIGAEIADDE